MRLYLTRHGQTSANVGRLLDTAVPGRDLTDLGRQQATALAEKMRREDLTAVYSSDLVRAQQTAAPLADHLGQEVVTLGGLREIQAGDWEMTTDWMPFVEAVGRWGGNPDERIPGGESGVEFMTRYTEALHRIVADVHARDVNASALAVSHGAAMRVWCAAALGMPPDWFTGRALDNTLVVTLEGGLEGDWRLLAWGDEPVTVG
ncbi:phosphoglycerate mutase [Humibacillus sp. DSM 29435]|uniref:histidine phosphatase family protein n=1 Tax=Humibacillus sp. DSM 29435 TaxID=1869167 RepID=UPI000872167D|nr:histidine phosphatase family protein [Humibacillus sp. DSM 29435]OFE15339.1 phosphoglycerate mutase [Humibacillus sp. DSM 29435]